MTPFVGLLKEHLLADLLWIISQPDKDLLAVDTPWGMPTWSWVSIPDGRVRLLQSDSIEHANLGLTYDESGRHEYDIEHESIIAHIVSTELVWAAYPLTSPILRARVTICGPIRDMKKNLHLYMPEKTGHRHERSPQLCGLKHHFTPYEGSSACSCRTPALARLRSIHELHRRQKCSLTDRHGSSEVYLDRQLKPETPIYGLFISINQWNHAQYELETMLLLTPVGNSGNEYRRVGVAQHRHEVMKVTQRGKAELDAVVNHKSCLHLNVSRHFALTCFTKAEKRAIDIV